jgi:hypothetical protein
VLKAGQLEGEHRRGCFWPLHQGFRRHGFWGFQAPSGSWSFLGFWAQTGSMKQGERKKQKRRDSAWWNS